MKFVTSMINFLTSIAVGQTLGNAGTSDIGTQYCHATFSYENRTCIPRQLPQQPQRITFPDKPEDDGDSSYLKKGRMVELYGETSYFGIPVMIEGHNEEMSSTKYNVHNAITNAHHTGVDAEFLHPYRFYEDGTKAQCNVGSLRKLYLTPCTINSHFIRGSGFIYYNVSYLNDANVQAEKYLPFSRVQRILVTGYGSV